MKRPSANMKLDNMNNELNTNMQFSTPYFETIMPPKNVKTRLGM